MPRGDGLKGMASESARKEFRKEMRERREAALQFAILDHAREKERRRRRRARRPENDIPVPVLVEPAPVPTIPQEEAV